MTDNIKKQINEESRIIAEKNNAFINSVYRAGARHALGYLGALVDEMINDTNARDRHCGDSYFDGLDFISVLIKTAAEQYNDKGEISK